MIRQALVASFAGTLVGLGVAEASAQTAPLFKVGVARRAFVPAEPYEWRGDAKHVLATIIWYPAEPGAEETPQLVGPPGNPWFDGGRAAADAPLASTPTKFPLIVLSHGTGGTGDNLAWLGTALARAGYIAAAVNHPGNNFIDGYTVQGFTLWWERAGDLSTVIDGMLADAVFGTRTDAERVGAAGFSLGGYTMIAIAGGITSRAHFREACASPDTDRGCGGPPEFPDLPSKAKALADSDAAFRAALAKDSDSYRDERVRAVFVMATGLDQAFLLEGLTQIDTLFSCRAAPTRAVPPFRGCASTRQVPTATRSIRRPCTSPRRSSPATCDNEPTPSREPGRSPTDREIGRRRHSH